MLELFNTQLIVAILTVLAGVIPLVIEFVTKADFSWAAIGVLVLGVVQIIVAVLTKQQARARKIMLKLFNTQLIVAILTVLAGVIPLVIEFVTKADFSWAAIGVLVLGVVQIIVAVLTKQQARARKII